jgi:regulatory protein
MIDDRAFARLWIEDRILHHPLARDVVARELREKQVPEPIASASLAEVYPERLERELVWRLARERYGRLAGVDGRARDRRTLSYLTRRGFPFDLSREIVRRLATGEGDG